MTVIVTYTDDREKCFLDVKEYNKYDTYITLVKDGDQMCAIIPFRNVKSIIFED